MRYSSCVALVLFFINYTVCEPSDRYLVSLKVTETLENFLKYDESYPLSQHINPLIDRAFSIGKYCGFSGEFSELALERLRKCPLVAGISPDIKVEAFETAEQYHSPRHLSRLSQRDKIEDEQSFEYCYTVVNDPVLAYVIDSGINIDHPEFGGRAIEGADFTGEGPGDNNGHGTHVAGLIGSNSYGSSKNVTLVEVKALDSRGSGSLSSIISAIEFAVNHRERSGLPGVANLSLGSMRNSALNRAVDAATETGLVIVVAAGNSNMNACLTSPASARGAITVGAINDVDDTLAPFTNWGDCVEIFASGVNVESVHYETDDISQNLSGTSMASPIVTGFIATLLSLGNSPEDVPDIISRMSLKGRIPRQSFLFRYQTPNKIAYNGNEGKCNQ